MNGQKTPFATSLNRFAERKINDSINLLGKALPCSVVAVDGSIITVKFEIHSGFNLPQVTIPHFGGEWIRYPVQVGDFGVVLPMDARLNAVTGIGSGTADLTQPANLTALVFMPVGNANWTPPTDPNKLEIYGKDGVIIKDKDTGAIVLTIDSSGFHFVGDITVTGKITSTGDIKAGTISLQTHKHTGVTTGSSNTGTPTP